MTETLTLALSSQNGTLILPRQETYETSGTLVLENRPDGPGAEARLVLPLGG